MAKPSKKRLGLLRLIQDYGEKERGQVYFPSFDSDTLKIYDLDYWDKATITCAEKAGLIETKSGKTFGWLTEAGKQLLERFTIGS